MKVFFDTNIYVAEALLGRGAERMIAATANARWRIYCTPHVLDEIERVITRLGFSRRFATLTRQRVSRRVTVVDEQSTSRHSVRADPEDSPILRAALSRGVDYLVTNDRHLLDLDPYEGVRIVSMNRYLRIVEEEFA
jgi:putative PIN family toxin of toxin-antitoxin system